MSARSWPADAFMATVVHGAMVAGLVAGFWDAGVCILGILLDCLAAYLLWFVLYEMRGGGNTRLLGKSFIGLSIGIWGYIAMFRAINLRDTGFLAMNFAVLRYLDFDTLDVIGSVDDDAILVILVILAAALLLVSLYFLAEILFAMPIGSVVSLFACVAALRVVDVLNNYARLRGPEAAEVAEENLVELSGHIFVKGWVGALLMYLLSFTELPIVWAYLAWSYAHDLLLRPLLGRLFSGAASVAPQQARA